MPRAESHMPERYVAVSYRVKRRLMRRLLVVLDMREPGVLPARIYPQPASVREVVARWDNLPSKDSAHDWIVARVAACQLARTLNTMHRDHERARAAYIREHTSTGA